VTGSTESVRQAALSPLAETERPSTPGARSPRPRVIHSAIAFVLPVFVLATWELAARSGVLRANLMPAPSVVFASVVELQQQGVLIAHILATCLRVLAGFVLGALAGTALGVLTGRSRLAHALLDPTLQAIRSIPSLAWVPLFLLWLGIQEASKVALIAVGVFFPVYLNLMSGIQAIDPRLLEVAEMFQYRGAKLARHVLLPAALPAYVTGLRSGLGLGWMFVVAAELMGASRGLGYLMVDGQTTSRPELIMAAILLFALLGKLSDLALSWLGVRLQRWRVG
jgi:sulfonate transport system permease protein